MIQCNTNISSASRRIHRLSGIDIWETKLVTNRGQLVQGLEMNSIKYLGVRHLADCQ